ncbi:MAG: hypothetical protein HYZ39_18085 [Mycolicibacterium cosmeticum]|nr:hypothetical protein [Mycolicibacterium cosmeticum]
MTRHDWTVSTYAGAAWGGAFWLVLTVLTSLLRADPPPNAPLVTVAASLIVGGAGLAVYRFVCRRVGAAVAIGAFIGLPVFAWLLLWQNVFPWQ